MEGIILCPLCEMIVLKDLFISHAVVRHRGVLSEELIKKLLSVYHEIYQALLDERKAIK